MSTPLAFLSSRFDRRTFVRLGLGASAVVGLLVFGGGYALLAARTPGRGRKVLTEDETRFLDAASDALFPPGNVLGVVGAHAGVADGADRLLALQSPNATRIFHAVMTLLDLWPMLALSSTMRFSALPLDARIAMLRSFDESSLEARRGLVSLVRVLVSMFVFEKREVLTAIGYRSGCIGVHEDDGAAP